MQKIFNKVNLFQKKLISTIKGKKKTMRRKFENMSKNTYINYRNFNWHQIKNKSVTAK